MALESAPTSSIKINSLQYKLYLNWSLKYWCSSIIIQFARLAFSAGVGLFIHLACVTKTWMYFKMKLCEAEMVKPFMLSRVSKALAIIKTVSNIMDLRIIHHINFYVTFSQPWLHERRRLFKNYVYTAESKPPQSLSSGTLYSYEYDLSFLTSWCRYVDILNCLLDIISRMLASSCPMIISTPGLSFVS